MVGWGGAMAGRKGGGVPPPAVLTERQRGRLLDAIRAGATFELAARYAGLGVATLARHRRLDPDLDTALLEAEGAIAVTWAAQITTAGRKDWRASAWMLARRFPRDYGAEPAPPPDSGEFVRIYERG